MIWLHDYIYFHIHIFLTIHSYLFNQIHWNIIYIQIEFNVFLTITIILHIPLPTPNFQSHTLFLRNKYSHQFLEW